MSRKNILPVYSLFDSATMTGTDVLTSSSVGVNYLDNVAIDLRWTGTPTGTFVVESSLDDSIWSELDFGSPISASGAAGDHQIYINQAPFYYLRVKYTNASGNGLLAGKINGKMV